MSLLLLNGEIIEIPEYIIRIVNKAQEIVSSENNDQRNPGLNIFDADVFAGFRTHESDPIVIGADGCNQTVSEYILGIIRAAQKIVQDDVTADDEIKDYDEFIDSTFDSMYNDADSDTNDESCTVIRNVVEQLIDEVCSTKFKMPELEISIVSTTQEELQESTENHDNFEQGHTIQMEDGTTKIEIVKEDNDSDTRNEETVKNVEKDNKISKENSEIVNSEREVSNENIEENKDVDHTVETKEENELTDSIIDNEELAKVAEKFVESICNEAKNELSIEQENKNNEKADSNNDNEKSIAKEIEEVTPDVDVNTKEAVNGQIDKQGDISTDSKIQNHTAKVHPEDSNPVIANIEDITQTDGLPTEGKQGKDQKYDVTKNKIKPKRRSRGLRNSFRRMFSCFSTKSSQLE